MAQRQLFTPDAAGKRTPTTDRLKVQLSENERISASSDDWLIDWIEFYAVSAIFQPCNGGFPRKKIRLGVIRQFRARKRITRHLRAVNIRQVRAVSYGHKRTIVSRETKELTITEMSEMNVENVNMRLLPPVKFRFKQWD